MSDETCGDYGGENEDGEPCGLTAGWGRDGVDTGPCREHADAGRPTKLTKENEERIAGLIEQGASISEAARRAGVHPETVGNWAERGRQHLNDDRHTIFREFFERLTRARGEGEGTYRQALMQLAMETNDTATLMAMLKQRYPDEWGDVKRADQAGGVIVNVGEPEEYEVDPESLEVERA